MPTTYSTIVQLVLSGRSIASLSVALEHVGADRSAPVSVKLKACDVAGRSGKGACPTEGPDPTAGLAWTVDPAEHQAVTDLVIGRRRRRRVPGESIDHLVHPVQMLLDRRGPVDVRVKQLL
jgi:hypothetical protein